MKCPSASSRRFQRSQDQQSKGFTLPTQDPGGEGCRSQQSMDRIRKSCLEKTALLPQKPSEIRKEAKPLAFPPRGMLQSIPWGISPPAAASDSPTVVALQDLGCWSSSCEQQPGPRARGMAAPLDQNVTHHGASPVKQDKYNLVVS